jgi:hypothetical protein
MRRFDPLTATRSAIEFYTQKKVNSNICLGHFSGQFIIL